MLMAKEWSDFAHERKALRVTTPSGGQRSTHYLQLPYGYALPLLAASAVLHWLTSQAIFLDSKYNVLGRVGHTGELAIRASWPYGRVGHTGELVIRASWSYGRVGHTGELVIRASTLYLLSKYNPSLTCPFVREPIPIKPFY
jgi:hypothetical protein